MNRLLITIHGAKTYWSKGKIQLRMLHDVLVFYTIVTEIVNKGHN
jgi:hypothetical protein